jgi:PAS domain S-box-containing protein
MPSFDLDEISRVEALATYAVLDTQPEQAFDDLCRIAAHICNLPVAAITFIAEERQFFKATVGIDLRETEIHAACSKAVLETDLLVVPDTAADPRFAVSPLLTIDPRLRFCAAASLRTPSGLPIGVLAVLDYRPHPEAFPKAHAELLRALARQVMALLEQRRLNAALLRRESELKHVQELAGVGGLEVDLRDTFRNRRSPEYLLVHGLPPEAATESHEAWVQRVHPEDREAVEHHFISAVRGSDTHYYAEYRIVRPSDGEIRWIAATAQIERDVQGKAIRLVGAHHDITERKTAEETQRHNEQHLRAILDTMPQIVWSNRPDGYHDYFNLRWYQLTGRSPDESHGSGWNPALHPDDRERAFQTWKHALANGEPYIIEYRLKESTGEYRWFIGRALPVRGRDGQIERWYGTCTDIHDLKLAQAALTQSEERRRIAAQSARIGVWDYDPQTKSLTWDDQTQGLLDCPSDLEISYEVFLSRVHPNDRPRVESCINRAFDPTGDGSYDCQYRVQLNNGAVRWIGALGKVYFGDGRATRFIGTAQDLTEQKRAEERENLIKKELHHRVKNTLATVQAIAGSTMKSAGSMEEFRNTFADRLASLGKTHTLITENVWQSVRLHDLLSLELAPYSESGSARVALNGPEVDIPAEWAVTLGMAVHELTTNAAKYGALSGTCGCVTVTWQYAIDGCLEISWEEMHGPPVKPPGRLGFGTQLLQRVLATQLEADVSITYPPEGASISIRMRKGFR